MLISLVQSFTVLGLFTISSSAFFANNTPGLVFDCRLSKAKTTPIDFDSWETSPYLYSSAFGQNLTWSQIITLPNVSNSLFDPLGQEAALEVSITDQSIFVPGSGGPEVSIRRADLSPNVSAISSTPIGYPDVSGIKTLHFSLMNNPGRSLNFSHSYNLVWMENAPFNHKQWSLTTGTTRGIKKSDPKTLAILGNNLTGDLLESDNPGLPFFEVPFGDGWHNFGLVLDFNHNTTQVFYSTGTNELAPATAALPNNVYGGGQYHFGVLKKTVGGVLGNEPNAEYTGGFQPSGIDESIIYAGVWMEDSADGQLYLSPTLKGILNVSPPEHV